MIMCKAKSLELDANVTKSCQQKKCHSDLSIMLNSLGYFKMNHSKIISSLAISFGGCCCQFWHTGSLGVIMLAALDLLYNLIVDYPNHNSQIFTVLETYLANAQVIFLVSWIFCQLATH